MNKIIIILFATIFLSGCSLIPEKKAVKKGVMKSADRGVTWEFKLDAQDNKDISNINVLDLKVDLQEPAVLYLASGKFGIFVSRNNGDLWELQNSPSNSVKRLAINKNNNQIIYASALSGNRGKIFKTENRGEDWKEIYTEPADGTSVAALALSPHNSKVLYAGTSKGIAFKTTDGGATWQNIYNNKKSINNLIFDSGAEEIIYLSFLDEGKLIRIKDGGATFDELDIKTEDKKRAGDIFSLAVDPHRSGFLYIGTNKGIYKSSDFGETWQTLNLLGSSEAYPIRAIAVSPKNSNEILYTSALALYRSVDGGKSWSTFELTSDGIVNVITYDPIQSDNVYLGIRSLK